MNGRTDHTRHPEKHSLLKHPRLNLQWAGNSPQLRCVVKGGMRYRRRPPRHRRNVAPLTATWWIIGGCDKNERYLKLLRQGKLSIFFLILLVQLGVAAGEVDPATLDPGVGDLGVGFEGISGGDKQGGIAAGFK